MSAIAEFFHMGGYGFYVWSSYALAFLVLIANVLIPLHRTRDVKRRLQDGARRTGSLP